MVQQVGGIAQIMVDSHHTQYVCLAYRTLSPE